VFGGGVYQAEILDKCKSLLCLDSYVHSNYNVVAGGINVNIGTPAQSFLVFLSPTADELIVSDARCGLVSNNCPKYCDDCKRLFGFSTRPV
jgi:hypothetical protein